jgi:hypothetical protein
MMGNAGELNADDRVPPDAPDEVKVQALREPRVPEFDATLGKEGPAAGTGEPRHRLVVIGDSLTHGFQSGAVFNTDLSYGAIIAYELGCLDEFRYPRYPGPGGLPLNIELLLRDLEGRLGSSISAWELSAALFRAREFMDSVEDYWERGAGRDAPVISAYNHALAVYGWDLRDALSRTAASCESAIKEPKADLLSQVIENNTERAALRVYPHWNAQTRNMSLFEAAAELGKDKDAGTDCGIETLVVFLGANNALQPVTDLRVVWSQDADYADLDKKGAYTVWTPKHFTSPGKGHARSTAPLTCTTKRSKQWWSMPGALSATTRRTGSCSTSPACSTGSPPAGTSPIPVPGPIGGRPTPYRARSKPLTRYPTRCS